MRKISIIILFLLFSSIVFAQEDEYNDRFIPECICENEEEAARRSITLEPGFETTGCTTFTIKIDPDLPWDNGNPVSDGEFNMNYVRTFQPNGNDATSDIPEHGDILKEDWIESITYFDGLGRPIQKVDVQASPYGFDIIQPIIYDDYGRVKEEYLPFTISQTGENGPGGYRSNPITEQQGFYSNYFPQDDTFAFSNKAFDGSPLNRVVKQSAPGFVWDLDNGANVNFNYSSNIDGEVPLFEVLGDKLYRSGNYVVNTLYKNTVTDENGNSNIEYKNYQGQVVLKQGEEQAKTFYIYDDFGLLRFVIPPLAFVAVGSESGEIGDYTQTEMDALCYYYEYDARKRMIKKKLPGAEMVCMAYNERDLLVASQDGNQREKEQWMFTQYDVFNRPIITGVHTNSNDLVGINGDIEVENLFEEFDLQFENGYSNDAFPDLDSQDTIFTITYYDNYDALSLAKFDDYDYRFKPNPDLFLHLEGNGESSKTKGMPTISYTKVLLANGETVADEELLSVTYYNIYGQPIQMINDNHLGGKDIISSKVNFTGDVLQTVERHIANGEEIEIIQNFTYDHGKRLLKATHQINEEDEVVVSIQKYNELGQLSNKKLHGALQQIDYKYNIRGWLTGINKPNSLGNDLFAMQLDYETGSIPQFNGNISSVFWSSEYYNDLKQYQFEYDALNRLTVADYTVDAAYSTSYFYDKNGNINNLSRNGKVDNIVGAIDSLYYAYNGNQLKRVSDFATGDYNQFGFNENGETNTIDYDYDANGNMKWDKNNGITGISYNHLNLPTQISIERDENKQIKYIYTATGSKLRKQTLGNAAENITTDYVGAFVYETTEGLELQFIQTSEGRIVPNENGGFDYEYALKDHLGNTRVMFNEAGEVLQDQSYYPFGMSMGEELTYQNTDDSPKNKYLYNGKELQTDFDLGWYDYGARFYDPAIGRWHVVDPLAEEFPSWTPYHYVHNNPIVLIDPTGMAATKYEDENKNLLLETNDGSDAVVTVTDDKRAGFDAAVKGTKNTDDAAWNNSMKKYALGFELSGAQEGLLSSMNSDWSRRAAVDYWKTGDAGAGIGFAFKEALSQWTNPELVVTGLTAGLGGLGAMSRTARGFKSFSSFKKTMGSAGKGKAWHHIVEQNPANIAKFGPKSIHNTKNVISLPHGKGSIHSKISGHYSSKQPFTNGKTVRQWLNTKDYNYQYNYGMKKLNEFGR